MSQSQHPSYSGLPQPQQQQHRLGLGPGSIANPMPARVATAPAAIRLGTGSSVVGHGDQGQLMSQSQQNLSVLASQQPTLTLGKALAADLESKKMVDVLDCLQVRHITWC